MKKHNYTLFLNSNTDLKIAQNIYDSDSLVRVGLHKYDSFTDNIRQHFSKIWIDPLYDGFDIGEKNRDTKWQKEFKQHPYYDKVKPTGYNEEEIKEQVFSILNSCLEKEPDFISIPQLPYLSSSKNNRINKQLAKKFGEWKNKKKYRGKSILPVIVIHQNAINSGTERTKRFKKIEINYEESGADGIWIADSSLNDQLGTRGFESKRFPSLIEFHEKIQKELTPDFHIAGPYWGLGILLWARGIISHPAFSIGSGYQYRQPEKIIIKTPSAKRLALPPLRRWFKASSDVKEWLKNSAKKLEKLPEGKIFQEMYEKHGYLTTGNEHSKKQIAQAHYDWFREIECVSKEGRALALYQILSNAYVLGSQLDEIPSEKGVSRKPEIVAKQLMLNCL